MKEESAQPLSPIVLTTIEEALEFLDRYQDEAGPVPSVSVKGDLARLVIVVDGDRYKGTVPGDLARGIWEFQEGLYKAAAWAIYRADDIRKLTSEQRAAFELVFHVQEASTDLIAGVEKFFEKLAESLFNMSDTHKAITVVAIVAIVTTGWAAASVLESREATKREQIKADTDIASEAEKTRQFNVLAGIAQSSATVQRFARASEDGMRGIMRGAPDASRIEMGKAKFSSAEVQEVNTRAPKVKSTADVVQAEFRIFGTESRHDGSTRYVMAYPDGTLEFTVTVNHDEFAPDDLEKMWKAAKERKPIKLEVNLTMNRGAVKGAQIVQVL
jgi:hypothetical protein